MIWAAVGAIILAFAISAFSTVMAMRVSHKTGMLDYPMPRKTHAKPMPLLGGSAIFVAFLAPSLFAFALASFWAKTGIPTWLPSELAIHIQGAASKVPMGLGLLAGAFVLHIVGLIDDRKHLGPWLKLITQLIVCTAVVTLLDVRILTAAGGVTSSILTIIWMIVIINAFNFLDNMDGLSAGVAAICAAALLGASAGVGQVFVSAWLCLMLGAVLGFLPFNFPPAKIFMGDSGSLVIGYVMAVVTCLTTYVKPDETFYLYGIFVPLVVMAVPLYDTLSVIYLRIRLRKNPMVGDRRHFSHRLLRRGMSLRSAVLTIYLCTAATAIAATLLAHVADNVGAVLVFAQTIAVICIVAILEGSNIKS